MGLLDGILNTASGLITGGFNAMIGRRRQKREFKQQEKLLNMQNDFTEKMWNMQNEYNDPIAQMERLTSAGINPIDAASGVAGNAGNAASVSSSSAPGVNAMSDAQAIPNNLGELFKEGLLMKHQVEAQELANRKMREEAFQAQIDSQWKGAEKFIGWKQLKADLTKTLVDTDLSKKTIDKLDYEINHILPEQSRKIHYDANQMKAQWDLTLKKVRLADKEIEQATEAIENLKAQRENINQSTDLMAAQETSVNVDTEGKRIDNEIKKQQRIVAENEAQISGYIKGYKEDLYDAGYNPEANDTNIPDPTHVIPWYNMRNNVQFTREMRQLNEVVKSSSSTFADKVKAVDHWNSLHKDNKVKLSLDAKSVVPVESFSERKDRHNSYNKNRYSISDE